MNAWIEHDAPGGVSNLHSAPDDQSLPREDQTALELGFPPAGGLTWRRRRVQQLRERIERGTYEVDPAHVAEAMVARLKGAS
jgi:anti-sigma28 factor (negative regulator of flagellin synthesis)